MYRARSIINYSIGDELQFLVEPASQNVTTQSTNNVVFNCTAYSLGYLWHVNGGPTSSSINIARGITESTVIIDDGTDLKIHLLYVPAILTNDNLTIICLIHSAFLTIQSPVAQLLIQGLNMIHGQ